MCGCVCVYAPRMRAHATVDALMIFAAAQWVLPRTVDEALALLDGTAVAAACTSASESRDATIAADRDVDGDAREGSTGYVGAREGSTDHVGAREGSAGHVDAREGSPGHVDDVTGAVDGEAAVASLVLGVLTLYKPYVVDVSIARVVMMMMLIMMMMMMMMMMLLLVVVVFFSLVFEFESWY